MAKKAEPPPIEIEQAVKDFGAVLVLLDGDEKIANRFSPTERADVALFLLLAARLGRTNELLGRLPRPGRM